MRDRYPPFSTLMLAFDAYVLRASSRGSRPLSVDQERLKKPQERQRGRLL